MIINNSLELYEKAIKLVPGGVNSPVRAFKSVGGNPLFIKSGAGSKIYDVDDNEYIDYVGSWGAHLCGHNPGFVLQAIMEAIESGISFGAPTWLEVKMAGLICSMVPSVEMVRMVNSGTEATMSAIRLARAFTNREKIIKFEGCYHGHADAFLIKAGSGALTFGVPTSPGVTKATSSDTLVASFNDIDSVKALTAQNKGNVAAIIIEPVAGNMGVIASRKDFLLHLRDICNDEGIVLIFDEVMTGFRLAAGGAQQLYGIMPDLTCFGKIIGAGLPVGAFGGRAEIMDRLAPAGPVYQAGTLSGNPIAMAAGTAMLDYIQKHPNIYKELELSASVLEVSLKNTLSSIGLNYKLNRVGSMLCLFFTESEVTDYNSALSSDVGLFAKYFHSMLNHGIYLPPSQFEAIFISKAHSQSDLSNTTLAFQNALEELIIK